MDQSILATRLVVRFFREHSDKPLEQIIKKKPQTQHRQQMRAPVERPGGEEGDFQELINYLDSRYSQREEMKGVARISVEV